MTKQKKVKGPQMEEPKTEVKMVTEEAVLDSVQTEIDVARLELEKIKMEIEEKKNQLQFEPRREISSDERRIIDKQVTSSNEMKASDALIAKQKAYDNVKVTGKFMNQRNPGQQVKLPYIKYADDPVKWHHFEHGKVYTIPRGFADQINDYYHTPQFVQKQGEQTHSNVVGENSSIAEVNTSNKKYAFVPVNF